MILYKIALVGIGGAVLAYVTGQFKKEYSTFILLALCLFLFGYLLSNLSVTLTFIDNLVSKIQIDRVYIKILLKLLAISFLCQVSSNICSDLGYTALSFQIETIGKISILILNVPIMESLIKTMEQVLT